MNELQLSETFGTPVTLVRVSPGHCWTTLAGSLNEGGVVSRSVMVWTALELLPQPSVAFQVRLMTPLPPQLLDRESE